MSSWFNKKSKEDDKKVNDKKLDDKKNIELKK